MYRIGTGYDVHQLESGTDLILGGIKIEHPKGLKGHSDADVLTHTIMDALLGALSLGSIGDLFPDTDPAYKGADSIELLRTVHSVISKNGYDIVNIDSVIMAEKPKLAPHISAMKTRIADTLNLAPDQIGIKATTTEKLGFVGREEGIASQASVLLRQKDAN